jgi:hypothetical protein
LRYCREKNGLIELGPNGPIGVRTLLFLEEIGRKRLIFSMIQTREIALRLVGISGKDSSGVGASGHLELLEDVTEVVLHGLVA